ncbi:igE-binding protein-like, partial [Aphis craccivora]
RGLRSSPLFPQYTLYVYVLSVYPRKKLRIHHWLPGNTYILTLQDDLTKYSMGIALPNHQFNTIAEAFVTNFVCTHGIPQTILTDQSTDFLSKILNEPISPTNQR